MAVSHQGSTTHEKERDENHLGSVWWRPEVKDMPHMDHTYKEMVLKGTVLRCSGYDPKCKGNGRELDCSINKKRFLLARNSIISCAGQTKLKKVPTKKRFQESGDSKIFLFQEHLIIYQHLLGYNLQSHGFLKPFLEHVLAMRYSQEKSCFLRASHESISCNHGLTLENGQRTRQLLVLQ